MQNNDSVLVEPWDKASAYRLENLGRFGAADNAIWRALLLGNSGPDCFVAVREEDGMLVGTTWSGRSVTLDPDTGEEVRSTLVKQTMPTAAFHLWTSRRLQAVFVRF